MDIILDHCKIPANTKLNTPAIEVVLRQLGSADFRVSVKRVDDHVDSTCWDEIESIDSSDLKSAMEDFKSFKRMYKS